MKILLVSWSVPPQSGGSSVIISSLAENFNSEELIVLGSSTWNKKNRKYETSTGISFKYFFSEIYFMGRGYRYFEWFRKWRFKPLVRRIEELIKTEHITHVIGVYPNPFYCLAASRAASNQKVHFSSYFHNTYIENKAITDPKAGDWQQEIFDHSERIFVMSKGMQRFYEQKYGIGKFESLVHTFKDFPTENITSYKIGSTSNVYKLVAIGNFNESNLDATKRFLKAIKTNPKYELSVYTNVPKVLLQKRGLDTSSFKHMGSVRPEEIHEALQKYDICILTHGFTGGYGEVEYKTIFPTRTIPMLLSGKPIFAHSPKNSFLNDFIKEHACAELVETTNTESIIQSLNRITEDKHYREVLIKNAKQAARLFYGPNVAKQLKLTLNEVSL